jgi:hypothetical protein
MPLPLFLLLLLRHDFPRLTLAPLRRGSFDSEQRRRLEPLLDGGR